MRRCLSILFGLLTLANAHAARLAVRIEHRWRGQPLSFGEMALRNEAGNELSVTRLAYLLSAMRLQRTDGSWLAANDWFAFIDATQQRTEFSLGDIPPGRYSAIRFDLGLDAATDQSDPATRPPGHPLHPDVNGLHWSWRQGYVFFAVEGRWRPAKGEPDGYSYHLAGEECRGTVEVPADLDLSGNALVTLVFDADRIFGAKHRVDIAASTSTHSHGDGGLASRLADNAVRAFALDRVEPDLRAVENKSHSTVTLPGGLGVKIPAHFSQANWPADNLPTSAGVALGERLFHDPRLSINSSQSCATCHDPTFAFADPRPVSSGAEGQRGRRNAMPLFNLAWKPSFFWDGRAPSLRAQVLQPIQDPVEMHETLEHVTTKLAEDAQYPTLFESAFGSREVNADRLARALEQFLLTLVSGEAKIDRVFRGEETLNDEEQRGFQLFFAESDPARGIRGADCFHCHGGANFTNHQFLNNGLDTDDARVDPGRAEITGATADRGIFMVPSLRNVALTAPYMHDGRFKTLEEVIEHYDHGIVASATLDPNLAKHLPWKGLGLAPEDKRALVAMLRTLTDDTFTRSRAEPAEKARRMRPTSASRVKQPPKTQRGSLFKKTNVPARQATPASAAAVAATPKNILLLIADDYGTDSSSLYNTDNSASLPPTPNIAALAASGVCFTKAYAYPTCSPTRACMLTGRYGFRTGIGDVVTTEDGNSLTAAEFTLPDAFAANSGLGYRLKQFGKWHLTIGPGTNRTPSTVGGWPAFAGSLAGAVASYTNWTKVITDGTAAGTSSTTTTTYASTDLVSDVTTWIAAQGSQPWFAWVAFNAPHTPFHKPPNALCPHYASLSGTTPDINAHPRSYYEAAVEAMDTCVGQILATVDLSQTHVIFMGDNGTPAQVLQPPFPSGHGKDTLYEGGVRVPLIISGPAVVSPGRTSDTMVHVVDLYSTILALAGIAPPSGVTLDSESLLPILSNGTLTRARGYAEQFNQSVSTNGGRLLRDDRYKLLLFNDGHEEFYDLLSDPYEQSNLVAAGLTATQLSYKNRLRFNFARYTTGVAASISSAGFSGNAFSISLPYNAADTRALWRTQDLAGGFWAPVAGATSSVNGATLTLSDPAPPAGPVFYSVLSSSP